MAFYKWFQKVGGDEAWSLILAEEEERIIRDRKPAFTTILAADSNFKDEMNSDDLAKVKYRGDFYVDFDASSIDEVIPQFQKFLTRLRDEHQFDLTQASLYASGGKGFHVTIPASCFIPKVSPAGYAFLPAIYREMAMELFVDTLDLRVYTARRGRMFRTANVERPDRPGVHKVPLSLDEALNITPEQYKQLCSAPRHVAPPAPPELNSSLALIFSSSFDKVEKFAKGRKKSKVDANLLKKFKGDVPPSILQIMNGEGIAEGVGFQKIATQLALAAHALGKSEEVFLELCEGLCKNHASDGTRYNTYSKRRNELIRMYQYMRENPCYEFSIGGVKSLLNQEVKTPDLDNGGVEIEEESSEEELETSITLGMRLGSGGIWKRTEDGMIKVCSVGLTNPKVLMDTGSGESIGYEVDCHVDGASVGSRMLTMDTFLSRQKFMQFTLATGGASVSATDAQIGALADILRTRARKTGNIVYTTPREGIDVVVLPDEQGTIDVVWADRYGVISKSNKPYKLRSTWTRSTKGEYKTDLRNAPKLEATEETEKFFQHLFNINSKPMLARLLGWYLACFICQPIRYLRREFPMLQVFGAAGSGKSKTSELLGSLHYWRTPVVIHSASGQTKFQLEALLTGSGSVPLILDEFKPREMRADELKRLRNNIRGNYIGETIGKGGISNETGQTVLETRGSVNVAPIVALGEALESMTAIMHRTVLVNLTAESKRGHAADFMYCMANKEVLSSFGRICIDAAVNVNFERLRKTLSNNELAVFDVVGERTDNVERQIFNVAVVLTGLEFGKMVLSQVFGDKFNEVFDGFREVLLDDDSELIPKVLNEATKMLSTLAYLSQITDENEKHRLVLSVDYIPDGAEIHINMRGAYTKYIRYAHSIGQDPYYDTLEAFLAAMATYPATVNKNPLDSPLKVMATTIVYSFDAERLTAEGVGEFRC